MNKENADTELDATCELLSKDHKELSHIPDEEIVTAYERIRDQRDSACEGKSGPGQRSFGQRCRSGMRWRAPNPAPGG